MQKEIKARNVVLPVTGMSCSNCALSVEKWVARLPGVSMVSVDINSEKASVSFDPGLVDELRIIESIRKSGYGVATGRIEWPVMGLKDSSDALTLERIVQRQPGVIGVNVNYGTEVVTIEFIPGMTGVSELAALMRKSGFGPVPAGDDESFEDVEERVRHQGLRRQKRLLALGLIFTIPLVFYSMASDFGLGRFSGDRIALLFAATVVQFAVGWQFYRDHMITSDRRMGRFLAQRMGIEQV